METMEARMVKLYARNNNHVALHAIPGHFATSHSHINFYIDMTSLKTVPMRHRKLQKVWQEIM